MKIRIGSEFSKERKEHPTLSDEDIRQIVRDHKVIRSRVIKANISKESARRLQRKLKSEKLKSHAIENKDGSYTIYKVE